MFCGHANAAGDAIESWSLLDLRAVRAALKRQANGLQIRHGDQRNADGSAFKWFDVRSFPNEPPLEIATNRLTP